MSHPRHLATALTVVVMLTTGCTADQDHRESGTSQSSPADSLMPDPKLQPVEDATTAGGVPRPLQSMASTRRTLAAAKTSHTRRDAEQFALEFAQLYIDARPDTDMEAVLSKTASAQMRPAIREFIASDLQGQQSLGAERHWDATRSQWIRSSVRPASGQPDRVNVEIAAAFVSEPLDLNTWYKTRVDVSWGDGQWQVVDLNAGDFGPDISGELTPQQRKDYLTGPGWRQISPA